MKKAFKHSEDPNIEKIGPRPILPTSLSYAQQLQFLVSDLSTFT